MEKKIIKADKTIRNIPQDEFGAFLMRFGSYIDKLLSLTGETSAERLEMLLPTIKEVTVNFTELELYKAFELYAKGELDIEPIDNYITVIQFHKVINSYKKWRSVKIKTAGSKHLLTEMTEINAEASIQIMEKAVARTKQEYIDTGKITGICHHVFDYLQKEGRLNVTNIEKKEAYKKAKKIELEKEKNRKVRTLKEHRTKKAIIDELINNNKNVRIINRAKKILLKEYYRKKY